MDRGQPHLPGGRSRHLTKRDVAPVNFPARSPQQVQFDDSPRRLRRRPVGIGDLGPAGGVGFSISWMFGLGRSGIADEVALGWRLVQRHLPARVIMPENPNDGAAPRHGDVLHPTHRCKTIVHAAAYLVGPLPPAMQALTLVVLDDERPVSLWPALR